MAAERLRLIGGLPGCVSQIADGLQLVDWTAELKTPDDDAIDHCLRMICRLFSGKKEGRNADAT